MYEFDVPVVVKHSSVYHDSPQSRDRGADDRRRAIGRQSRRACRLARADINSVTTNFDDEVR